MSETLPTNSEEVRSADTSPTIGKLALALAKAQAVLEPAKKNHDNPFFKSKYADLSAIWESIRKPLADNELAVIQTTGLGSDGLSLITLLAHSSGEWIRAVYPIRPVKNDPQGIGSAITYARRYALAAISGATAEGEDDDGNAASENGRQSEPRAPAPAKAAKAKVAPTPPPLPAHDPEPTPPKRTRAEVVEKVLEAFEPFHVTRAMIEDRYKLELENFTKVEFADLKAIHADIEGGVALSEHFDLLPGEKD